MINLCGQNLSCVVKKTVPLWLSLRQVVLLLEGHLCFCSAGRGCNNVCGEEGVGLSAVQGC